MASHDKFTTSLEFDDSKSIVWTSLKLNDLLIHYYCDKGSPVYSPNLIRKKRWNMRKIRLIGRKKADGDKAAQLKWLHDHKR